MLDGINEILNDKDVIECQNSANLIYKDNYVKDCIDQWLDKKIPKAAREKMEKFNYDQWVHFTSKVIETGYEEEKKKRKEEYKLILGIDPLIFKVNKNSHPSYINAAIEIANKAIASSHTSEKDLIKMKNVLKKLS